jgi:HSP20 family protein
MLTISSERTRKEEKDNENYYRKEFSYQSFSRSFNLPDYTDENQIDANYKDGILHGYCQKRRR